MKKLLAILLTFAMVFSFASVSVFADSVTPTPKTGTITINKVSMVDSTSGKEPAADYVVYKIFDLADGFSIDKNTYSYTVTDEWKDFVIPATAGAEAPGAEFFIIEDGKYVKWAFGDDESRAPEFAKIACAWAKEKGITPTATLDDATIDTDKGTIKFSGLPLGYYLGDSTMGSLCGLTTTNYDAQINAKNGVPVMDKQVHEDSIENSWQGTDSADIGQNVDFKVTINVHPGAEDYILHDTMSEGLTFVGVTSVTHNGVAVDASKYEVFTHVGHTGTTTDDVTDACTFEVRFKKAFCDSFQANDKVEIFYKAVLNEKAVIAGEGNSNEAKLEYGEDHFTETKTTKTFTYSFEIAKTDGADKLLGGAEFKIYTNATATTGEEAIGLVDMGTAADGVQVYRRATESDTGVTTDVIVANGLVRVEGFDNGTYYLEETKAPNGYNPLTARQRFIISDGNLDAIINGGVVSTGSGVHVVNKTGNRLPETGGMGTMMFVLIGTVVVLGAGVLLVTKKRMSMIDD